MCSIEVRASRTTFSVAATPGQTVADALVSSNVPPSSVVVFSNGDTVADTHTISEGTEYKAIQLENYNLDGLLSLYDSPSNEGQYLDRQITISPDGDIENEQSVLNASEFRQSVERTLIETIERYSLVSNGDTVLFGLSGGVDSTALLTALCTVREQLPPFDLKAITVEEPWSESYQQGLKFAKAVTDSFGVEHQIQTKETVRDRYGLTCPVEDVVEQVSNSGFSTHTVAMTDQIITREIESLVRRYQADTVMLAAHTTDVVERHIDPMSDTHISGFPENTFGGISFGYPGIYLSKKQLALYLQVVGGLDVRDQFRESWINQPGDESMMYYIAELLQWYWPGIEHWIVESSSEKRLEKVPVENCTNCGKTVEKFALQDETMECITCDVFRRLGVVEQS